MLFLFPSFEDTTDEEPQRFSAFLANLAIIERRNALEGPDGATHGWTKYIDLTPEEVRGRTL